MGRLKQTTEEIQRILDDAVILKETFESYQQETDDRLGEIDSSVESLGSDIQSTNDSITSLDARLSEELGTKASKEELSALSESVDERIEGLSDTITTVDNNLQESINTNYNILLGKTEENKSNIATQGTELEKKANQDGKYPQLTSGFASNLVGRGESTESEFSFRASGGKSIEDGAARISELRGNGVVLNQLYPTDWVQGISTSVNGVISIVGTPTENYIRFNAFNSNIQGHKYLFILEADAIFNGKNFSLLNRRENVAIANGMAYIFHSNTDATLQRNIGIKDLVVGETLNATARVRQIDLTLMFGAGNEPTTVKEFYARKPIGVDDYAYNEGTLIPFNADAIKSVGFNAWDEKWELGSFEDSTHKWIADTTRIKTKNFIRILPNTKYHLTNPTGTASRYVFYDENQNYLSFVGANSNSDFTTPSGAHYMLFGFAAGYGTTYNNDVCIHLVHTGYRNGEYQPYEDFVREIDPRIREVFPNGMKPWDKVYNKNGKGYIVKGSGEVDMGDAEWLHYEATSGVWAFYTRAVIPNASQNNSGCNIIAPYYTPAQKGAASFTDKNFRIMNNGMLYVRDDRYTDTASFKTAMQGVMLWYELAEPEVIEYDEPFNLDYTVWDFGTEEILSEQPSAPISADIIYQFNAVDTIRNNQIEIAELKAMIATMQAQMASLTSQINLE